MAPNIAKDPEIKKDRLRFTKNKLSADLILAAIAVKALSGVQRRYWHYNDALVSGADAEVNIDEWLPSLSEHDTRLMIGASILYNLVFMLVAFLASEGVKGYNMSYSVVSILLGGLQIGRIFYLPMKAYKAPNPVVDSDIPTVMGAGQFRYVAVCLCVSAVLLCCAGVIGIIKTTTLNKHQAKPGNLATRGSAT